MEGGWCRLEARAEDLMGGRRGERTEAQGAEAPGARLAAKRLRGVFLVLQKMAPHVLLYVGRDGGLGCRCIDSGWTTSVELRVPCAAPHARHDWTVLDPAEVAQAASNLRGEARLWLEDGELRIEDGAAQVRTGRRVDVDLVAEETSGGQRTGLVVLQPDQVKKLSSMVKAVRSVWLEVTRGGLLVRLAGKHLTTETDLGGRASGAGGTWVSGGRLWGALQSLPDPVCLVLYQGNAEVGGVPLGVVRAPPDGQYYLEILIQPEDPPAE